jgi:hypothetical protein
MRASRSSVNARKDNCHVSGYSRRASGWDAKSEKVKRCHKEAEDLRSPVQQELTPEL